MYDNHDGELPTEGNPIVIIASSPPSSPIPHPGVIIYFQVPRAFEQFKGFLAIDQRVHIHLFGARTLNLREVAINSNQVIIGHTTGSQKTGRDGVEGTETTPRRIGWIIDDLNNPHLTLLPAAGIPPVDAALKVNIIVDDAGTYRFDYSPPPYISYQPILSEHKVMDDTEVAKLKNSDLPRDIVKEILESHRGLKFIESISKKAREPEIYTRIQNTLIRGGIRPVRHRCNALESKKDQSADLLRFLNLHPMIVLHILDF